MVVTMKDSKIKSIKDVKRFLKKASELSFKKEDQREAYDWVETVLKKFKYLKLSKKEKGVIKEYIEKMTGYSRSQVTRLIEKYVMEGTIKITKYNRNSFAKVYSDEDIELLAKTDEAHDYPNGASLKKTLGRMADVYGVDEYSNIQTVSQFKIWLYFMKSPDQKR